MSRPVLTLAIASAVGMPLSLLVALYVFWPGPDFVSARGYYLGQDFVNFWAAGRLALNGRVAAIYDFDAYNAAIQAWFPPAFGFLNFSYPPHALPLLALLGALPYTLALGLWQVAGLAAFLALCLTGAPRATAVRIAPYVLVSPIVLLVVMTGQSSFFFAGLLVAGLRLVPARPVIAGVLFGLLTIKPQLGVLVPPALLVMGDRRAFACAALTAIALVALSLALYGLAPWYDYITVVIPYQRRVITEMVGLYPIMMTTPYAGLWQAGVPVSVALALHTVIALAVAAAALQAIRRADPLLATAMLATAAVILPPYCLNYDLAIPLAAITIWLLTGRAAPRVTTLAAIGLVWALAYFGMTLALWHLPLLSAAVLGTFVALYAETRRSLFAGNAQAQAGR